MVAQREMDVKVDRLTEVEVSSLRQEILETISQGIDITKFAVTTTVALLGASLVLNAPQSAYLALVPLLLLEALAWLVFARSLGITRIAAYLATYGEGVLEWEARTQATPSDPGEPGLPTHLVNYWVLALTGLVCPILSMYLAVAKGVSCVPAVAALVLWVIISGVQLVLYFPRVRTRRRDWVNRMWLAQRRHLESGQPLETFRRTPMPDPGDANANGQAGGT